MQATELLHEHVAPFDHALHEVDARKLRAAFAELVDQALGPLTAAHLDLDDVLLEHYAVLCDTADSPPSLRTIELTTLADHPIWIAAYNRVRQADGAPPCRPESTRFQQIRLKVMRENVSPLPDFRVQSGQ
jgi:hypothetical protein